MNYYELRKDSLLYVSVGFLLISIGLYIHSYFLYDYQIQYESIDVKDMAVAKVVTKSEDSSLNSLLLSVFHVSHSTDKNVEPSSLEEVALPKVEKISSPVVEVPQRVWYLPTEMGYITQNPYYGHVAYDLSSPRGTNEVIYPVANGVVSGIYYDSAGALVVTVLHNIDGVFYTSLYAHLSRFANISIGQNVDIYTPLGWMGSTGYSTGVHLHLTVLDCALFQPNDPNCKDLNSFFRYSRTRINQGFSGLGSLMAVPGEWNVR